MQLCFSGTVTANYVDVNSGTDHVVCQARGILPVGGASLDDLGLLMASSGVVQATSLNPWLKRLRTTFCVAAVSMS